MFQSWPIDAPWSSSNWSLQELRGRHGNVCSLFGHDFAPPQTSTQILSDACVGMFIDRCLICPKREGQHHEMMSQISSRSVPCESEMLVTESDHFDIQDAAQAPHVKGMDFAGVLLKDRLSRFWNYTVGPEWHSCCRHRSLLQGWITSPKQICQWMSGEEMSPHCSWDMWTSWLSSVPLWRRKSVAGWYRCFARLFLSR